MSSDPTAHSVGFHLRQVTFNLAAFPHLFPKTNAKHQHALFEHHFLEASLSRLEFHDPADSAPQPVAAAERSQVQPPFANSQPSCPSKSTPWNWASAVRCSQSPDPSISLPSSNRSRALYRRGCADPQDQEPQPCTRRLQGIYLPKGARPPIPNAADRNCRSKPQRPSSMFTTPRVPQRRRLANWPDTASGQTPAASSLDMRSKCRVSH